MAKKIERKILKKSIFYVFFIVWFIIVFMFSNQNGAESGKVSEKVTKKILQTKDTLEIVEDKYKETNEIVIKGIQTNPITKKRIDKWEKPVRKLAHYILFLSGGIIIFMLFRYAIELKKNYVIISLFFGLLMACLDEFHQLYSLNRTPRIFDVFIDTAGIVTGIIISLIIDYFFIKIVSKYKVDRKSSI